MPDKKTSKGERLKWKSLYDIKDIELDKLNIEGECIIINKDSTPIILP